METAYVIILGLGVILAVVFSVLVLLTGKGDAMGGGSGIRTTFKGKASFDDIISNWTLYIGGSFMLTVLLISIIGARLPKKLGTGAVPVNPSQESRSQQKPAENKSVPEVPASK